MSRGQSEEPLPLAYASTCTIPTTWIDLPILKIASYNHDTSIFTFGLPAGGEDCLGLPTCACLLAMAPGADHDGTDAIRPYTPISAGDTKYSFDLLVKRYDQWGTKCPENSIFAFFSYNVTQLAFKPKGAMSNHIFGLTVGDTLKFRHMEQNIKIQYPFHGTRTITMIAVGVGIAPMIQALHEIFSEKNADETQVVLLYGVRTVTDILLREMLEGWAARHPDRFRIVFGVGSRYNKAIFGAKTVEERIEPPPPAGFDDLVASAVGVAEMGWIDEDKIRRHAFPPAADTKVFVCGLPGVYDHLCGPRNTTVVKIGSALHNVGYSDDMVIKF